MGPITSPMRNWSGGGGGGMTFISLKNSNAHNLVQLKVRSNDIIIIIM